MVYGGGDDFDEIEETPHPFLKVTHPKKRAYLIAQSSTPVRTIACKIAGISSRSIWNWNTKAKAALALNPNDEEAKAWLEAVECAKQLSIEAAEDEAWTRAVHGWKEPVFGAISEPVNIPRADGNGTRLVWAHRTGVVGEITKKSDTMLIFMLKGAKPETYRERFEHSGPDGAPLQLQIVLPDNGRARRLPEGD